MILTLSITNVDRLDNGEDVRFVLDERGAVIGRSPQADWSLPDPLNYISSTHCEIDYSDGRYVLNDKSTNGTFLNGAVTQLAGPHELVDGDEIVIGKYKILAGLTAPPEPAKPEPEPEPEPEPPPARSRTLMIPESEVWEDGPEARGPDDPAWGPAPSPSGADLWATLAGSHEVDWARGGFGAELEVDGPTASAGVRAKKPGRDAWSAFQTAMGLAPEDLKSPTPAAAAKAGMLLRRMVAGLVVMLEARARAKADLGAAGTRLEFDGNNPLKFARTPAQALVQLLNPQERGYMTSETAVEDAFRDLHAHQIATLSATHRALHLTLDRFSPASIRQRSPPRGLLATLFPGRRDTQLWRDYERDFEGVAQGSEEAFVHVFAEQFRAAYEDAVAEMKRRG